MAALGRMNAWVNSSKAGRFFCMGERETCLTTELRAGIVTFLTMAYILAVNAQILTDSGGPCTPDDCSGPTRGDPGCKFDPTNTGYLDCLDRTKRSLITATAAASCIGTFLMGIGGNLPLGIAPGMGLNAYFAYNVVGFHGSGSVSYKTALAAIFVEGWIFILLAVTGARGKLIQLVPRSIMLATSAGIGLFLAFIGLQSSEGLGVVTYESATLVTLGGCPFEDRAPQYTLTADAAANVCNATAAAATGNTVPNLGSPSSNQVCLRNRMESATLWLGLSGFVLIALCMRQRVRGAMLVGILWVTFISWIPDHAASFLGADAPIAGGADRMSYFKNVVATPNASFTAGKLDFGGLADGQAWLALITFLYVDFLDATGTLFSMANFVNSYIPGFIKPNKTWPRSMFAFSSDGAAIVVSSLLGSSPCTVFVESASGIREGGRTGVAAIFTSFLFFIALFFTPILASIPPYAVGPALITVGAMMVGNIVKIRWDLVSEAVPAFVTIALMPLTYSIAYGFIGGIVTYILLNGIGWVFDWMTKKGVPFVGPSEILLDQEDKAGRNVYAKNASVGGHIAQPTAYDSKTHDVAPVAKDVEGGPSETSSDTDALPQIPMSGDESLRRRSNPTVQM
jgi:AGZA family xanthine/uracil permease-like MFS transporter